ncbi:TIGR04282 family arsenosugar biosynthesis glycosyltransferase [Jejudonia soesokkakensis]|uniref:TIGR04282 family arsenosugar biosynthesis glycosyltransferase n=1 Tax=Jejudonia soesokkakensis TaxID=1323432 RepID=A0ABW2MX71_9FLAO
MGILGVKETGGKEKAEEVFHYPTSKNALIIFTRNPELGKCKTRLAATVGDESALEIYKFLLNHTVAITKNLKADKFVFYSEKHSEKDIWDTEIFSKKVQQGNDLGIRMQNAFTEIFELGYQRAIIIGSDMYDLSTSELQDAFTQLEKNDFVLGPAQDGGYYLLGMKKIMPKLFKNKVWGTAMVQAATLSDLKGEKIAILKEKNDVDYFEDIKDIEVFQQFLPSEIKNIS